MPTVTLKSLNDPERFIQAIKALRNATAGPGVLRMPLRDAKHVVEAVRDGRPTEVEVQRLDGLSAVTGLPHDRLADYFALDVADNMRDLAVDFLMDVLSIADADLAFRIQALPSCIRLAKAAKL